MTTLFRIRLTGARITKKRGTTLAVRGGGGSQRWSRGVQEVVVHWTRDAL